MAVVNTEQPVLVEQPPGADKQQPHAPSGANAGNLSRPSSGRLNRTSPSTTRIQGQSGTFSRTPHHSSAIEQEQRADEHHDEPEDDPRLTHTRLARGPRHVHTSRYAAARRRGAAFPAKAGDWPVNGGFLVAFRSHAHRRDSRPRRLPSFEIARLVGRCLALFLVLSTPLAASAGPLQDDLKARRTKVMERLGPESIAIFWSAPTRVYSADVDYEYRQESNLLYLTGIDQPDTVLVLMPGNRTRREILFIREADARREHWQGHSLTAEEATAQSGVPTVMTGDRFDAFVAAMFSRRAMGGAEGESEAFFSALNDGRARLSLLLEPQASLTAVPGPVRQFGANIKDRFFGFAVQDATPILWELRQIKTPYEQAVMRKSLCDLERSAPGRNARRSARQVRIRSRSGDRVCLSSQRRHELGVSLDRRQRPECHHPPLQHVQSPHGAWRPPPGRCRCQLPGLYRRHHAHLPVGGTFAPLQRDIYEIVLAAQEAGMAAAKAGNRFTDIQAACDDVLRAGLVRLGLVTDPKGQQFKIWSTHGVSHWIGMEVHDVGVRANRSAPGMTFVIEPGIYIREAALDNLPKTAENAAFIEKVRAVVQKYKDIGVRIEDSFLLTETGLRSALERRAANGRRDRTVHGGKEIAEALLVGQARGAPRAAQGLERLFHFPARRLLLVRVLSLS